MYLQFAISECKEMRLCTFSKHTQEVEGLCYICIIHSAHLCNRGVCNCAHLGISQYAHIILVLSGSSPSHDNFSMLIQS
jgi:hypothetical protein